MRHKILNARTNGFSIASALIGLVIAGGVAQLISSLTVSAANLQVKASQGMAIQNIRADFLSNANNLSAWVSILRAKVPEIASCLNPTPPEYEGNCMGPAQNTGPMVNLSTDDKLLEMFPGLGKIVMADEVAARIRLFGVNSGTLPIAGETGAPAFNPRLISDVRYDRSGSRCTGDNCPIEVIGVLIRKECAKNESCNPGDLKFALVIYESDSTKRGKPTSLATSIDFISVDDTVWKSAKDQCVSPMVQVGHQLSGAPMCVDLSKAHCPVGSLQTGTASENGVMVAVCTPVPECSLDKHNVWTGSKFECQYKSPCKNEGEVFMGLNSNNPICQDPKVKCAADEWQMGVTPVSAGSANYQASCKKVPLGGCNTNQELSFNSSGNFSCKEIRTASQCPNANDFVSGFDFNGKPVCSNFSYSTCPAGQVMSGIDQNGNNICVADRSPAAASCGLGKTITGFDANGAAICANTTPKFASGKSSFGAGSPNAEVIIHDLNDGNTATPNQNYRVVIDFSASNYGVCESLVVEFHYWSAKWDGTQWVRNTKEHKPFFSNRPFLGSARGGTNDWAGESINTTVTLEGVSASDLDAVGAYIEPKWDSPNYLCTDANNKTHEIFLTRGNPQVKITAYPIY
jgi:hypothetical protein